MNLDALKKATDLNIIIDGLLRSSGNIPDFSKECEEKAMDSIEKYTSEVTGSFAIQLQELVEEHSGMLKDCISEMNRVYYRNGMQAGAVLLMQLMGF